MPRRPHAARLLRLPPELERAIATIAEREYRTFTAQVVKMLTEWLAAHPEAQEGPGAGREPPHAAEGRATNDPHGGG